MVHVFGSAPRRQGLVGWVMYVFIHPVRIVEESLDMAPRALDRVCVCLTMYISDTDRMVHGVVSTFVSRSWYASQ